MSTRVKFVISKVFTIIVCKDIYIYIRKLEFKASLQFPLFKFQSNMNSKLSESSTYFFYKKDRSCFWEAYCLMLGTFPKDFSQVSPSQGYLSK